MGVWGGNRVFGERDCGGVGDASFARYGALKNDGDRRRKKNKKD